MEEELITVVVPIYRVEKYLVKCIDSIIEQSYKNIELILVDDGSPDKCPQICDEYKNKDSRIKVIHKQNGGLSDARNEGLKIATGEWITFIDSDDYVGINFLEKLYSSATSVGADISICDYQAVSDDTGIEKEETNIEVFNNVKCLEEMYHPQKHGMEFVAWGKLYRTALFKKNKIEYPVGKIHEDTFTTYKLIYVAKEIAFTNCVEYFYRKRENSIMTSTFSLKRLTILDATEEACEFFLKRNEQKLFDLAVNALFRKFINLYIELINYDFGSVSVRNEEQRRLIKRFNENYNKYMRKSNLDTKHKLFYKMFGTFPAGFYENLLK